MNRSLLELKICLMAALPLLCAGRIVERIDRFAIEPIRAQRAIFGQIVAYPWQLRTVNSWFDEDGLFTDWRYARPAFPAPVKGCEPVPPGKGEALSAAGRGCGLAWESGYLATDWDKSVLSIRLSPAHIDPALAGDGDR